MAGSGKPTTGKSIIYIVQPSNAPIGSDAKIVGNQTEGTWTREQETVDEQTKLGRIVGYGAKSETFELTLYAEEGDEGQEALTWTYDNESELKVWRVNVSKKKENGKYSARFGYTIIENLEAGEPTDGFVEISTSLPVLVRTVPGEIELPDDFIQSAQEILFETPGETTGGFENRKQPTSTP
ncbi:phage major tail protein, TP901-1 family [Bacillus haynesii]|uniref:phage major tail protein, TP901-1 family n=1 Tax=Bacillus haynesii TaxID=1925021 RepID=UPI001592F19E|nr:phage major tail protein, TP901-1 family [Bacillus haynesii]MCY8663712.1 phage major tail protein, TP901-1 family [Bacillus haynesii]MEC1346300.1 phage major tail protein, TP901-1 family [Bacillus haynesii]MEC1470454.1 phage major tail protein, TP901-1 family [Bacillus haynesii]NVB36128.1 phage major tail protein, TP901-1 family [Bacillus licheniformis]